MAKAFLVKKIHKVERRVEFGAVHLLTRICRNGSFSPVCAISRMNTTEILNNPQAMVTVKKLMNELIESANAMGYDFDAEAQMQTMIQRTQETAMDYKPSMLLDLERGQPMEVAVILGTPLKRAKAKGLNVPSLELMHDLCSAINAHTLNQRK